MVLRGLTLEGLRWSLTAIVAGGMWHPLTMISHMLDVQLFGLHPGSHHLVSVFFHGLNAVLVFHALRHLTGDTWRSAAVAAIFAVHPLRVESVAWVSERKDLLSALFFLLALCVYARYVRTRKPRDYAMLVVCFVLGVASKPMVITLPFVLLLIDYWPLAAVAARARARAREGPLLRHRRRSRHGDRVVADHRRRGRLGREVSAGRARRPTRSSRMPSTSNRPSFQSTSRSCTRIPARTSRGGWSCSAAAVVGGITIAALFLWPRHPYALIGWLWFLGMLVPVIGLVQVGAMAHADRYTYLPQIGLLIAVVWTVSEAARSPATPALDDALRRGHRARRARSHWVSSRSATGATRSRSSSTPCASRPTATGRTSISARPISSTTGRTWPSRSSEERS